MYHAMLDYMKDEKAQAETRAAFARMMSEPSPLFEHFARKAKKPVKDD